MMSYDEKERLLAADGHYGNENQIWRDRKKVKTVFYLSFNCIFGCRMKGPKDTPGKIAKCKECSTEEKPNVIFKDKVSRQFAVDGINFFNTAAEAASFFEKGGAADG